MANVTFHPATLREYQAAVGWYQQRSRRHAMLHAQEAESKLPQSILNSTRSGARIGETGAGFYLIWVGRQTISY